MASTINKVASAASPLKIGRINSLADARRASLALYKQILSEGRKWPTFERRAEEEFRDFFIARTKTEFRKNAKETDLNKINKLLDDGRSELEALRSLRTNTCSQEYRDRKPHVFPAQFPKAVKKLIDSQEKQRSGSSGLFSKLMSALGLSRSAARDPTSNADAIKST
eukprot:TRINITY_DN12895_c0_g1_i1.p1 TRINITY_DN12895_c0_g1~~TRINITY_DN12895_c0_g1_i1.p1  ORF type:complete len:167 (-),score=36.82 TRINITY_DN12895_c0_g1_i1:15-515(-)